MTGKESGLQAITIVRLLDRISGKPIHVSHEYSLEKDGGCSREEVTERLLRQGGPLTIIGFLEKAQPLPYSSAAIVDYPDIHFTRKQEAWRLEKSEVAGGGELPQPVSTSMGVILPLICYDAYRFGSGKAPLGPKGAHRSGASIEDFAPETEETAGARAHPRELNDAPLKRECVGCPRP